MESVTAPGLVLAEELTEGSALVRAGRVVEGYWSPEYLEPGQATLAAYDLMSLEEVVERHGGYPRTVPGTRPGVFAIRRLADDPALDVDLAMASTPMTDAVREIMGPGWVEPHRAAPPPPGSSPGGRRRRSQVAAGSAP